MMQSDNEKMLQEIVQNTEMGKNTLDELMGLTHDQRLKDEMMRQKNESRRLNQQAHTALDAIRAETGAPGDVTAGLLARFPDVLAVRHANVDEEALWQDVAGVCDAALHNFIAMRAVEGEKLKADVLGRLAVIEKTVGKIEEGSAQRVEAYTQKLYARLQTILQDQNIDQGRILTEAAIFADKVAVDEETVRLRSHVAQLRTMLQAQRPTGKDMDFLMQEFNRECNTIGSKCNDLAVTQDVVAMKAEVEKIREQVQNIE